MIQAIIFDFDGLILDTETPDYISWKETYENYGFQLPLDIWQQNIGTIAFDAHAHLEKLIGYPLDRGEVRKKRKKIDNALIAAQTILPGVEACLEEAKTLNLKIGLASSSTHRWVNPHLERLGLTDWFDVVSCSDDVNNQPKPNPAVYQLALQRLNMQPKSTLALEDSPNGIAAAKGAGLWCVAIPNQMTQMLDLSQADYRLNSLADMPLSALLKKGFYG